MRDRHPEGPGSGTRSASYRIVPMPPDRRNTADYLDLYWWKHTIYALLEVDVTDARALIAAYESRSGEAISFTGYLTHCLARAVAEDTSVQACRQGRRNLAVFDDVDVFLSPVNFTAAPPHDDRPVTERTVGGRPYTDQSFWVAHAALAGLPALSAPAGHTPDGLPVGLQVIGRAFDEQTVLRVADAYERASGFSELRPPTATS